MRDAFQKGSCVFVSTWSDLEEVLQNESALFCVIAHTTLRRLGPPILKQFQDKLNSSSRLQMIVECQNAGEILSCLYHGVKIVSCSPDIYSEALSSLAQKKDASIMVDEMRP